jgi:hypothetical protein
MNDDIEPQIQVNAVLPSCKANSLAASRFREQKGGADTGVPQNLGPAAYITKVNGLQSKIVLTLATQSDRCSHVTGIRGEQHYCLRGSTASASML